MPDWSYRTLFRPVLFRLGPERARDLTVSAFGALGRIPLGPRIIRLLGHAHGRHDLALRLAGIEIPSPIGLGAGVDLDGRGLRSWGEIGLGFVEIGPVADRSARGAIERDDRETSLRYREDPASAAADVARRLARRDRRIVVGARVSERDATALRRTIAIVDGSIDYFSIDDDLVGIAREVSRRPVFAVIGPAADPSSAVERALWALDAGAAGIVIAGGVIADGVRVVGAPSRAPALATVRALRSRVPATIPIVASGGVIEPADGVALLDAGASAIQLHSGLVFSGPALPRRIKSALRGRDRAAGHEPLSLRASWTWLLIIGLGLVAGGIAEGIVAATSVVLPYDEDYLGMRRGELSVLGPLLEFMRHDRLTLAGATAAVGMLYVGFTTFAVRRGASWARTALLASGTASASGSLVLPFVYGYPDPLHLLIIGILIPLFAAALIGRFTAADEPSFDARNDRAWSVGLWGQLCFVAVGAGLVAAGSVISVLGATAIFVPEDLVYLGTSAASLNATNPHLLPVVAHDRSNFGSTLIAAGLPVALAALWGFHRGARWLWWTLALAGAVGFAATFAVHAAVGYVDLWHLAPAYVGVALYAVGLACSHRYLCDPGRPAHAPGVPRAANAPAGSSAIAD